MRNMRVHLAASKQKMTIQVSLLRLLCTVLHLIMIWSRLEKCFLYSVFHNGIIIIAKCTCGTSSEECESTPDIRKTGDDKLGASKSICLLCTSFDDDL